MKNATTIAATNDARATNFHSQPRLRAVARQAKTRSTTTMTPHASSSDGMMTETRESTKLAPTPAAKLQGFQGEGNATVTNHRKKISKVAHIDSGIRVRSKRRASGKTDHTRATTNARRRFTMRRISANSA